MSGNLYISVMLVPALLDIIAREVGCSVARFSLMMRAGKWMSLDILDDDFEGDIDFDAVSKVIAIRIAAGRATEVVIGPSVVSEGGTIGLQMHQLGGGVVLLQMAVL